MYQCFVLLQKTIPTELHADTYTCMTYTMYMYTMYVITALYIRCVYSLCNTYMCVCDLIATGESSGQTRVPLLVGW